MESEEGNGEMNAGEVFDALEGTVRRLVRTRMDYWLDGNNTPPRYFHGWTELPDYKQCFVFKWEEERVGQRLYGFLCNPKPISDPGFRVCVLIYFATKHEAETDFVHLDRINRWRQDSRTRVAIKAIYPEHGEQDQWTN